MKNKIKYQCSGCHKYFDLAKIPEKAYDSQTGEMQWLCPSCYQINSSKIKKYNK